MCCFNGNCPKSGRPPCENSMFYAPAYCADMGPDPSCYRLSWPKCCVEDGPSCTPGSMPPPCDNPREIRRSCNDNNDCLSDEYCAKFLGQCDQTGLCYIEPQRKCPADENPVCGCDDKPYQNACYAYAQGKTTVKSYGECSGNGPDPKPCQNSFDCEGDEFCKLDVGNCGGTGQCVHMPDECPAHSDPVCGCDNKTYYNECVASVQGRTTVKSDGQCEPSSPPCYSSLDCEGDEFCKIDIGNCGGKGQCVIRGAHECTFDSNDYLPVCGCDGKTYVNECVASVKGMTVKSYGECGGRSTCTDNSHCPADEFCAKENCGQTGQCVIPPTKDQCPHVYDPVCSCDNYTVRNACNAVAIDKRNIKSYGECKSNSGNPDDGRGVCFGNNDCLRDEYCNFPDGDCGDHYSGECVSISSVSHCFHFLDHKVCGCDNVQYKNSCTANQSGTSIRNSGECFFDELAFE
jgi:hypothetical protein